MASFCAADKFILLEQPAGNIANKAKINLKALEKSRRYKKVKINHHVGKGDKITLNLFDDINLDASVEKVSTNINKTRTVRFKVKNQPFASAYIATTKGRSLGVFEMPEIGKKFIILSDPNTLEHYLIEAGVGQFTELEDAPAMLPLTDSQVQASEPVAVNDTGLATVEVMIIYSPAARDWANGSSYGPIENVIAGAMENADLALANTNAQMQMKLVYSGLVNYTESGDSGTDLQRLTSTNDGYIDEIHQLRDDFGADLVALFLELSDTGGRGWLLSNTNGSPNYAFSLTRVQQASWTYTTIHEWGHNMGCHHRIDQVTQPGPGLFSYSAGWRWIGTNSSKYCSVMSYEEDNYDRVAYFSDPDTLYQGVATGDYADGDNARTLREIKDVIAGYRTSTTNPIHPDINADGFVDFGDFGIIAGSWQKNTSVPNIDGDVTGDGYVGYEDIARLGDFWLDEITLPDANFYSEPLDTDPGWSRQGDWQFGTPQGLGGTEYGNADPGSGFTGENVFGYNLAGDYRKNLQPQHLTTNAINCSNKSNVHLEFYRWLNVESMTDDHASVQISTDGFNFTQIWQNSSAVTDDTWQLIDLDISQYADNQPSVYIRWTMGSTDRTINASGWNIDDITLYESR